VGERWGVGMARRCRVWGAGCRVQGAECRACWVFHVAYVLACTGNVA